MIAVAGLVISAFRGCMGSFMPQNEPPPRERYQDSRDGE
jgi:hypothetical protein